MNRNRTRAGFTLVELMIVVTIIAIIASIAIPKYQSARLAANESVAIATLRSLSSAQAEIQAAVAIDTDADGTGEYGYFAELAGAAPMRIAGLGGPAAGLPGRDELNPVALSRFFGNVDANGVVMRSGYCFAIHLPVPGVRPVAGLAEASGGGVGVVFPGSDNGENLWCAYAWPLSVNRSGNRVFFINQDGDLLQMSNRAGGVQYSTALGGPMFDAAFLMPGDLYSKIATGMAGVDMNTWRPVQ